MRKPVRRTLTTLAAATALALALTACGSSADPMPGMSPSASGSHDMAGMGDMPGMSHPGAEGDSDGLAAEQGGYRLDLIGPAPAAGAPAEFKFKITAPGGKALAAFATEHPNAVDWHL
ncbi:hypothetical protein ABT095_15700 [Kitasatospora sp. NPDC002227]|uniref:hypothetical protein n=1 Tax=Kitasatospora sp. NPDC002227 TaxID=3154773 RepID=UPI0033199C3E